MTGTFQAKAEESTSSTAQSSRSVEITDTTEAMTSKSEPVTDSSAMTEPSVEKEMDTSATDTEKIVEQPVVASETKENTLSDKEMKDTLVVV